MKKVVLAVFAALTLTTSVFAQALPKSGVKNTLWTGFGLPTGLQNNDDRDPFRYHGLIDTLQVRVDVSKFTIDGMLAWGALTNWNGKDFDTFTFLNTDVFPSYFFGGRQYEGDGKTGLEKKSSYYVNMLFHPFDGFDLAMGTDLYWVIGPCPGEGGKRWDTSRHVKQGDMSPGVPGKDNGYDVVGFIKYAANYTNKPSLGVRYRYKKFIEVGGVIPSGATTNAPVVNVALAIQPVDFIRVAASYEGLLQSGGNFYTGASLYFTKDFNIDAYLAITGIGTNNDDPNNKWGTGAALFWRIPQINLSFRPEIGLTEFGNTDYTFALYTGVRVQFDFAEKCHLGAWTSFAWGAENSKWHDKDSYLYATHKDWNGGFIFNIRPEFVFDITPRHSLAVTTEYQFLDPSNRTKRRDAVLVGFYWTYKNF